MTPVGKALWYVESHFAGEISLDQVAAAGGVSRYYLARAFAEATGSPVAAYVRARRLSEAARALANGAPDILSVALAAGYGSHEAFTRAFRQHFNITPEDVRARASVEHLRLQEPLRMNPTTVPTVPAPRITHRDGFLAFGLSEHYQAGGNAGIPAQWHRFGPYIGHIAHQLPEISLGIVYNVDPANNF